MTASYHRDGVTQRQRREMLLGIRERLGDRLFADFMVDAMTGYGMSTSVCDLPALVDVWMLKQRLAA
jgi:hypothetical protein